MRPSATVARRVIHCMERVCRYIDKLLERDISGDVSNECWIKGCEETVLKLRVFMESGSCCLHQAVWSIRVSSVIDLSEHKVWYCAYCGHSQKAGLDEQAVEEQTQPTGRYNDIVPRTSFRESLVWMIYLGITFLAFARTGYARWWYCQYPINKIICGAFLIVAPMVLQVGLAGI